MTRKDYQLIAKAIGEAHLSWEDTLKVVKSLGHYLLQDNANFNLSRFTEAVRKTWEECLQPRKRV